MLNVFGATVPVPPHCANMFQLSSSVPSSKTFCITSISVKYAPVGINAPAWMQMTWSLFSLWSHDPGACGILGNTAMVQQVIRGLLKHFFFFIWWFWGTVLFALLVWKELLKAAVMWRVSVQFFSRVYIYINYTVARSCDFFGKIFCLVNSKDGHLRELTDLVCGRIC